MAAHQDHQRFAAFDLERHQCNPLWVREVYVMEGPPIYICVRQSYAIRIGS